MSGSTAWHAWRLICLPYAESVLGRTAKSVARRCSTLPTPRVKRIQVRHVSFTQTRRTDLCDNSPRDIQKDVQDRIDELKNSGIEHYPRINQTLTISTPLQNFVKQYSNLENGQIVEDVAITVKGRIASIRKSGGKLAFVDVVEEPGHHRLQVVLNLGRLPCEKNDFAQTLRLIRRGDIVSVKGLAHRTSRGEVSLLASDLPKILAPCLHTIPLSVEGEQEHLDKHVQMLSDPQSMDTQLIRSRVIKTVRNYFEEKSFYEVQTPILAAAAGGATARPFETTATEFTEKKLALRIAPELWLKRLIIGGWPKVFEIGPSFRNEGLDRTHNPEFTTCEFYAAYHELHSLQRMTEDLFRRISADIMQLGVSSSAMFEADENGQFREIDFIPAINAHLKTPLPDLASPDARSVLVNIFQTHSIPLPSTPTLPRLLDKLCSQYLEPTCEAPTWIINTPECLSPLAKSFVHPTAENEQRVAARAELFINGREMVNCYEEENSPFEQRRKFVEQQIYAKLPVAQASSKGVDAVDDEAMKIDEDYLRALEWGLPPTGGWGCGIDRLVMLCSQKDKIGDVLSFGSLRAVTRGAERWADSSQTSGKESANN